MGPEANYSGEITGFALVLYLVYMLVFFGLSVAQYVFQSWGVYTIAKRRSIPKPGLAWVPWIGEWMLGSISDQYQYVTKGKVKNKRKALLALQIIVLVLFAVFIVAYTNLILQFILTGGEESYPEIISAVLWLLGTVLAMSGVTIAFSVIRFMALYDLYRSCEPNNAVLYLVLSIFFGISVPVFVFICRKKDDGMPPRRDTIPPAEACEN